MRLNLPVNPDFTKFLRNYHHQPAIIKVMIDYERLEVYKYALEFMRQTVPLREILSKGNGELTDQFRRASFSMVLNIAEGSGRIKTLDKRRFYAISRGSAFECGALLDLFHLSGLITDAEMRAFKTLLRRIVAMLSALCRPGIK